MSETERGKSDFRRRIERQTPAMRKWDAETLGVVGPRKQRTEIGEDEYMTVELSGDAKMLKYTNEKTGESVTVPVDVNEPLKVRQAVHVTYDENLVAQDHNQWKDPVRDRMKRVFGHPITPWIIAFFPAMAYALFSRLKLTAEAEPTDARTLFGVLMIAWTMSNAFYGWLIGERKTEAAEEARRVQRRFEKVSEDIRVFRGNFESHVTGTVENSMSTKVTALAQAVKEVMEEHEVDRHQVIEMLVKLRAQGVDLEKFTTRVLEQEDFFMRHRETLESLDATIENILDAIPVVSLFEDGRTLISIYAERRDAWKSLVSKEMKKFSIDITPVEE